MIKRISAFIAALALANAAYAQTPAWPTKPIRIVVPYSAGGPTDLLARQLGQRLTLRLGQPVIIDNKAGAGGTIGVAEVLKAAPDGHTLALVAPGPVAGMPALTTVPYTQNEIGYITLVARNPAVIAVTTKSGINSLDDLIRRARAAPGQFNFSSAGNGTTPHIGSELFVQEAKIQATHIPYKGTAPAMAALIAGDVQFISTDLMALLPHARSGTLKLLAVSSPRRASHAPEVPTTGEAGLPQVVMETNYGLLGPRDVPADVQRRIRDAVAEAVNAPEMKDFLHSLGAVAVTSTGEEYRQLMATEQATWRKVAQRGNIRLD